MKSFLASVVLSLGWCLTVQAAELSLGGSPSIFTPVTAPSKDAPFTPPIDRTIHLGLDRHEENNTPVCELPSVQAATTAADAPVLPTVTTPPAAPSEWVNAGAVRTLTLDAPRSTTAVGTLAAVLPTGVAADSGVPDPVVYAGLGVLLLALLWVCSGAWNRRSPPPTPDYGERQIRRQARVKMVALKVNR